MRLSCFSSLALCEEHHFHLGLLDHTIRNRSYILLVVVAAVVGTDVTNCYEIYEFILTGWVHLVVADHLVDCVHWVLKSQGHEASDAMRDLRDKLDLRLPHLRGRSSD